MPEMKEQVLTRFEAAPSTSTRVMANEMGISQPMIGDGRSVTRHPRSSGPQPTGLFLLGEHEILMYEMPVDSAEDLVARIVALTKLTRYQASSRGCASRSFADVLCAMLFVWFLRYLNTAVDSGWNSNIPLFCLSGGNATLCSYVIIGSMDGYYHPF
ncbi:hypothetical protein TNCV_994531 [Trichonephila clavipes]|nr:hypothetical protein TNCV_994531 [Trichonephila clavipes]